MKNLITMVAMLLCGSAWAVAPSAQVTFTPATGLPGQRVTVTVGMRGDVSTPPFDTVWPLILSYEDMGIHVELPPINSVWTIQGVPGKAYANIAWSMTVPPGWTFSTAPSASGYLGGVVSVAGQVVTLTASALPPDGLATVIWENIASTPGGPLL